jgi:type I restriction enzyme R subunit
MNNLSERAFEANVSLSLQQGGWQQGDPATWNKELALFPSAVIDFVARTQPKLWADMQTLHGAALETLFLKELAYALDHLGMLHVLRHGFKFYGRSFRIAYFKPAHNLSTEVVQRYEANVLTATRQVPCHPTDGSTVDVLLALNGLPVATIELKNPNTGQTWRDAIRQYQQDRKPDAPLFAFKRRALVHFAADPDEVHMTTELRGPTTTFLPFNRGSSPGGVACGAGNPANPNGYRTDYFWREVLARESFLDVLANYLIHQKTTHRVDDSKGGYKAVTRENLLFPRYHQLDATRRLVAQATHEGAGHNYLIQHSAGSGKTNSISWLAHRLSNLHTASDARVFDCVLVITDRQVLDKQLQDAVYQIEHAQGVVAAIDENSKQLAEALVGGSKIVITTLQKFPFVLGSLLRVAGAKNVEQPDVEEITKAKEWEAQLAKRRYALIVDEAHSSQTGEAARKLKSLLSSAQPGSTSATAESFSTDDDEADYEEQLAEIMRSRGRQPNLSFFAFTATPKGKTLEIFGRKQGDGAPQAFHIYSMRQAIEEGFILDVLQNYTTYDTYFRLAKAIEDDPEMPVKKAARAATQFAMLHPTNIQQRIAIIVQHFREHVRHLLEGQAKAMVVTASRLHAVKYTLEFKRYLAQHHITDVRPLVAFSGTVTDDETSLQYTEPDMNRDAQGKPISEKGLPAAFDSEAFNVLLVANKYQTGFDQPKLVGMYVDKRLDGVAAVQTLSRLNRKIAGKDTTFVLDFANSADDIYKAFKPYYDATALEESSDPRRLHELKHELDHMQVYHLDEVRKFGQILLRYKSRPSVEIHVELEKLLQPAVDRFRGLASDDERDQFRDKLKAFVHLYSFLSHIIPFTDQDWEELYMYGDLLRKHLPRDNALFQVRLTSEVELHYYKTRMSFQGAIQLKDGETATVKSPTDVGTRKAKDERAPLSEIIEALNERFNTNFTEEDRLFFEQIGEAATQNQEVILLGKANDLDDFKIAFDKIATNIMVQRSNENDQIVSRYTSDEDFKRIVFEALAKVVHGKVKGSYPK